ncbi:dihydrodipicolinate synthase family protein [Roseomonas terrae]|uniref:Dihydrodipicolinate synthase family protein n=1 Tax=Neoroseomonas terrae TaxID=424799 RepID=A0ABS5EEG0_9PROT|nr:dihydrodipicolinate synthase family protein [Neoroseomonas terrae]MBR0649413.1 dihydrodipicolinate synthase family protein [Neoroseomonas terrae]
MLDRSAKGVFVIAPTPFLPGGALDLDSTDRMTDAFIAAGASGMTILGVMGEAPKLTEAESLTFVDRVLKRVKGRIPVVVGASAPGFAQMKAISRGSMDLGAAGIMVSPAPGLKGDEAVVSYIAQAMDVVDGPFVLQDYPQLTGITMTAAMIARMAQDQRMVMLKAEDWPGLDKLTAVRKLEAEGKMPRVAILGGVGGQFLPEELARGADGIMTGYAYPEMLVKVCQLMGAGRRDAAQDLFDLHLPLIRTEVQPGLGLAIRKYVLKKRGIIAHDVLRAPGPKMSAETAGEVDYLMGRLERAEARLAA